MVTGVVKFFNEEKGFGFIRRDDGGDDVFVHISQLRASNIPTLNADDRVQFSLLDRNGRTQAQTLSALQSLSPEQNMPEESKLVQMARARRLREGHAPATLEAWKNTVQYLKTGSPEYVFKQTFVGHINRPERPAFEGDWETLSAWCKLVGLKISWVDMGGIGPRDFFERQWHIKISQTLLPDTRLKNKLLSEYGTPPGY